MVLKVIFFLSMIPSAALAQEPLFNNLETPKGEATSVDPALFPSKAFDFKQCSERIPFKKGKNPWIKIVKKNLKSPDGSTTPLESYYVSPAKPNKQFAVVNDTDPIYAPTTSLVRIDCKNGLVYFQKTVREPFQTTQSRVFDLVTGSEYPNTEGGVTLSIDKEYLVHFSADNEGVRCGNGPTCDVNLKLYTCKQRISQYTPCSLKTEQTFRVSSAKEGAPVFFSPLPVKWKLKQKKLTLTLGGSSRSKAQLVCKFKPDFECHSEKAKGYHFMVKK